MSKGQVYLETTIPSYLAADPSADRIVATRQYMTHRWWLECRQDYSLFISQVVLDELGKGDARIAQRRLEIVRDARFLASSDRIDELATELLAHLSFPNESVADAVHIAVAAVNGLDYLLTWNFRHLANPIRRAQIQSFVADVGLIPPLIATPEELLESA